MRTIGMFNKVSLDGYFAGPNGEIDWFDHDPEIGNAAQAGGQADTILFGRVTYEMFASNWPAIARDPHAPADMRAMGEGLGKMNKVVFSTTLKETTWENSRIVRANLVDEVRRLKQQPGSDMVIFGSGTVVRQLASAGLIDHYQLVVAPVVLGAGKSLFQDATPFKLTLMKTFVAASGSVLLTYKVG